MNVSQKTHPSLARRIGKIVAWCIAVLAILIAVLVVFILTFDWNRARPWVNEKVSEAIGRPFVIEGDLKVGWRHPVGETGWRGWGPWPRFSAANITIANPDWTKQPHFATLDEIDFEVAVLPLLAHDIVIPAINLVNPSVDLERVLDGRNNWTFKLQSSAGPSEWKLELHDIAFAKANIAYSDEQKKTDMQVVVDTLGQPIPIGDVMKQQEAASRKDSAQVVGKEGASKLTAQANAITASEATAASAAAEASSTGSASAAAQASAATAGSAGSTAAAAGRPGAGEATMTSVASAPINPASSVGIGAKPPVPPYALGWT